MMRKAWIGWLVFVLAVAAGWALGKYRKQRKPERSGRIQAPARPVSAVSAAPR